PLPRPRLRPLWTGAVTPGRDAVLRCEGHVPDVSFLLLRSGEEEPSAVAWTTHPSADLVLTYVGPQHAGNYSCAYRSNWAHSLLSQLSDPVELQVAGGAWFRGRVEAPGLCPDCTLLQECPFPHLLPALTLA
ncbi:alpha-1B-glycoprotein-like, partial [Physeter macrocephalus]|uniref:Alpha-1B-glycoprotein-like n=1 Tax=Physeter macrocephalus TaxID=9755 RepID=A0A9W2WKI6_PHYMC